MSEGRPISMDQLMEPFSFEQLLEPLTMEVLGVTEPNPMECLEDSDLVALRLACIGDEMDLHLRSPRLAQLSRMTMHSLGLSYNQTDGQGVLGSVIGGFTNLREKIAGFWRSLSPGRWVLLLLLLLVLLLGAGLHLLLK
ncbi:bcl-2-interacting killer [Nycticebus coucang]|uniref:bcl-2-interacting killer n=1 Tax=Nycticebus coucang TaxID=9470 RepID=UPI00234D6C01|nr:bcl-2-interacting killer [Nycticebus coucang]XP_053442253.1 bcl-2-interacting killer [Nycticebus coucang]XP_053442254.1 bcl-2-interacting killer [Nycticebus coucang]XP_053442255.1 bcl-2-interacting killer [Nycticebus coucang]XP_053442256.1 bcl-2-interacting killer [Nycticebus coucang]XP_053442258.1 bcl-2-interacting killer [Nycticebus coucang]